MRTRFLEYATGFVFLISCHSISSVETSVSSVDEEIIVTPNSAKSTMDQDSIARLQREQALESGGEEALMELMKNEENIFIKYEHRFKKMMKDDVIPETFPVYIDGTSEKDYLEIVDFWAKNNPDFLKPQFRR